MRDILRQIKYDIRNHLDNNRTVAVFAPPIITNRLMEVLGIMATHDQLMVRVARLTGEASPHYNTVFIIDPDQIEPRVLEELKMVADGYSEVSPMTYYIHL